MAGKYYRLNDKITEVEVFVALKEANKRKWRFSISTELENLNFRDVDHDDLDLRDEFSEIQASNDVYRIIGFIVLEGIKINSVDIFNGKHPVTFFLSSHRNIVHFTGNLDELKYTLSRLSLNTKCWIDIDEEKL